MTSVSRLCLVGWGVAYLLAALFDVSVPAPHLALTGVAFLAIAFDSRPPA